jgi:hypothetical protein
MNNTQQTQTEAAKLTKLADALESIRHILEQLDSEEAKQIASFDKWKSNSPAADVSLELNMLRDAIEDVLEAS